VSKFLSDLKRIGVVLRGWRFDLIVAAALIMLGLLFSGLLPRYYYQNFNDDHVIRLDSWLGEACSIRVLGSEDDWKNQGYGGWRCSGG